MNALLLIALRVASSIPEVPEFAQEWWNTPVLGYTTIGGIVLFIGGFAYTLVKARLQRKAVSLGLKSATSVEAIHYNESVEHRVRQDLEIQEMRRDIITLAETSVRKEAKQIADKYKERLRQEKVKEVVEVAKPFVEEVIKKAKKKFR
jgi:hypothetical protein